MSLVEKLEEYRKILLYEKKIAVQYSKLKYHIYEVFKNVKALADKLDIKSPTEIVVLVCCLIHSGCFNMDEIYNYDEKVDISIFFPNVDAVAQIIRGSGNCLHTALFLSAILDFFEIENKRVSTKIEDDSTKEDFTNIYLLYNDIRKYHQIETVNHMMNYYKDGDLDCFVDITGSLKFCYVKDRYIYSFNDIKVGPLYINNNSFNVSRYDGMVDFRRVKTLSDKDKQEVDLKMLEAYKKMNNKIDLMEKFKVENSTHYDCICNIYNRTSEKERVYFKKV